MPIYPELSSLEEITPKADNNTKNYCCPITLWKMVLLCHTVIEKKPGSNILESKKCYTSYSQMSQKEQTMF